MDVLLIFIDKIVVCSGVFILGPFLRLYAHYFSSIVVSLFVTGTRQHCMRAAQSADSYLEGDFEVFRPEEATRCTDGVQFGMEEWTDAKFHPKDKGIRRHKLKILLKFLPIFGI